MRFARGGQFTAAASVSLFKAPRQGDKITILTSLTFRWKWFIENGGSDFQSPEREGKGL